MTDQRIAEIEAKIAEAQAEIAALKAGRPAAPSPPKHEGARIVQVLDERSEGPNLAELKKLFSIVRHRVPERKTHDADQSNRDPAVSARRRGRNLRQSDTRRETLGKPWWIEGMTDWLRARNAMTRDVDGASFVAATMASGDILFVPHDSTMGYVWEFAIVPPGHGGGKPASDAWRTVLSTGNVLPPSAPARRVAAPSQVRIYGG
jgi:hypothetical protein